MGSHTTYQDFPWFFEISYPVLFLDQMIMTTLCDTDHQFFFACVERSHDQVMWLTLSPAHVICWVIPGQQLFYFMLSDTSCCHNSHTRTYSGSSVQTWYGTGSTWNPHLSRPSHMGDPEMPGPFHMGAPGLPEPSHMGAPEMCGRDRDYHELIMQITWPGGKLIIAQ